MTTMLVKLKSARREARSLVATYEVTHVGPSVALTLEATVIVNERGEASASINVEIPEQASVQEALRVLGDWLVRTGTSLQEASDAKITIPIEMTARR
jgi:hypothetical protein